VILQGRRDEFPWFFGKLISTLHSYQSTAVSSLACIVLFLLSLDHLLSSFLLLPGPLLIALIHGDGLYGICVFRMVVVVSTLLPYNKLSISIDGAIAFDHAYLIHNMRPMRSMGGVCFLLEVPEVFVLGDVVAGFACLLMHVDAVQVNGLHLLLRAHQLPLTLALHPILVVVLVGRRLHLLAAPYSLLRSAYPTQKRIGIGGECGGGGIVFGILAIIELRGVLGS
jgi:hypothetical protein